MRVVDPHVENLGNGDFGVSGLDCDDAHFLLGSFFGVTQSVKPLYLSLNSGSRENHILIRSEERVQALGL
jgi:hypothetical protein